MTTKKTTGSISAASLSDRFSELQASARKQVEEGVDQLIGILPVDPSKAVKDLRSDFDKTRSDLSKRADKAVKGLRSDFDKTRSDLSKRANKAVKGLRSDFDKTSRDLSKRADKAVKEVRKQAEGIAGDIREQVEKAIEPVSDRLDFASRTDVDGLGKRLDKLERRIGDLAKAKAAQAPKPAPKHVVKPAASQPGTSA